MSTNTASRATARLLGNEYQAIILGPAQTQGSKKLVRNKKTGETLMLEASDKTLPWRQDLVNIMRMDRPQYPLDCAVEMRLIVYVARPRKDYNARYQLKVNAPPFPKTGRDQDKVERAVGDAAKIAGWLFDDSRIAHWDSWRLYAEQGEPERVVVTMRELTMLDAIELGVAPSQKENLDKPLLAGL